MNRASIFVDSSSIITIPEHLQESDSKTVRIGRPESDDPFATGSEHIYVESAAKARELAAALLKAADVLDSRTDAIPCPMAITCLAGFPTCRTCRDNASIAKLKAGMKINADGSIS